jgi:hypothetical protein
MDLFQRHQTIPALPGRLVLDRSFISEMVYGPSLTLNGARAITTLAPGPVLPAMASGC